MIAVVCLVIARDAVRPARVGVRKRVRAHFIIILRAVDQVQGRGAAPHVPHCVRLGPLRLDPAARVRRSVKRRAFDQIPELPVHRPLGQRLDVFALLQRPAVAELRSVRRVLPHGGLLREKKPERIARLHRWNRVFLRQLVCRNFEREGFDVPVFSVLFQPQNGLTGEAARPTEQLHVFSECID